MGLASVDRLPAKGDCWAVKLNLTYPSYLPGVVNSPIFIEGLCRWASDWGVRLIFVEGDGGNGAYSAQDAFDGNGVTQIANRHKARCLSLSEHPWEWRETVIVGKRVRLPYSPFFRRREYDRFISTPLFKNHIFTTVSLGMKNLWGCIPDAFRMYYHYQLDHGIVALCKELNPDFSIFDGLIALRGRGPMEGMPIAMNALMVASDIGAGEAAALQIMGIPIARIRHLQLALTEGLMPVSAVNWMTDPAPFVRTDFILEKTMLNHISIQLGRFPFLQKIVYHSALSPAIYAVINRLRGNSAQTKLHKAKWSGTYHRISRERPDNQ